MCSFGANPTSVPIYKGLDLFRISQIKGQLEKREKHQTTRIIGGKCAAARGTSI
jgi:hypothetical protein